jgi:hypothetical protein
MRSKLFQVALLIVGLTWMVPSALLAAENLGASGQGRGSEDQKYAGEWVGTYSVDNAYTNKLSYTLSKDEKGQWRGMMKWVNQSGDHTADLKFLQVADGKMKGKVEIMDGQMETTVEGQFQGDRLEGTYAVSPKGSTEVVEKGTWKVAKSAAAKTGQ